MKRRQVPSAYRRVRRAASLLAVVALALCSTASSFVVPHPPALSTHSAPARGSDNRSGSTCSASTGGGTVRRQRSSDQASSKMMEAATGAGDTDRAWQGITVTGPEGIPTLEGESLGGIMTAEGAAVFPTAAGATAASAGGGDGGRASLLALSNAPARTEIPTDVAVVGAPQQVVEKEYSIEAILKELAEIQNQGPKNYCVLGTRHCSFLHQQIIELLAYALVLSGNHVFTSGAMGTNAATIRGALRAERKELLTVVLPQSLDKQSEGSRDLIQKVTNVVTNPQNDHLPLDVASRLCNSDLLSRTEQLICFAFHDSNTIIETTREARSLNMIVTELYLD
eukprot:jgi/Undpi1/4215/HiC_scaffold_16.g07581.m1